MRYYEAELHRIRGELLLMQNNLNAGQPESCFQRAIEVRTNAERQILGVARDHELSPPARTTEPPRRSAYDAGGGVRLACRRVRYCEPKADKDSGL